MDSRPAAYGEKKEMKNMSFGVRVVTVLALVSAVILMVAGAGNDRELTIKRADVRGFVLPKTQIISWDDTVGLLDTTNGAVYRLSGQADASQTVFDNPSVRVTWKRRVAPVKEGTSGYLGLQRSTFNRPDGHFLVDIVTGKTWILRKRASTNREWVPVTIE
jgi:hypothetical protein